MFDMLGDKLGSFCRVSAVESCCWWTTGRKLIGRPSGGSDGSAYDSAKRRRMNARAELL